MRKILIKLEVKVTVVANEGISAADIVDSLDYGILPTISDYDVVDTEITDYEVLDSK